MKIEKYAYLVFGSIVGASVALLLAPQSGARTRRQLAKYGKKAGNRAQEFVGEIAESLDGVLDDVFELGEQGLKKGKKLTEKARGEIMDVLDAGQSYLQEERSKLDKILK